MPYPSSPDNVGLRFLCNVHEFSGPCLLALCLGPRHTKSLVLPEHHRFELAGRRLCDEENHYFLWKLSGGPVSTRQWLSCDRTREEPISADACGEILGDIPHRSSTSVVDASDGGGSRVPFLKYDSTHVYGDTPIIPAGEVPSDVNGVPAGYKGRPTFWSVSELHNTGEW